MIFSQTFSDPTKRIIYPSTWGGKTAPQRFEDMKAELWYVCLAFLVRCAIGFVWLFLLYSYYQLLRHLNRLNQLPDEDMEKMDNARYLGNDFRLRWIMIGLILLTITGMWLHFTMTREAIFYGGIIWAVCYYFRNALTEQFNNIKARIIKRYKTD